MWITLALASAACDAPATRTELTEVVDLAVDAFVRIEEAAFEELSARARTTLPCVREPLLPPDVAAWHRFAGLVAFYEGHEDRAAAWFAAARRVEPAHVFTIAPSGSPLADVYQRDHTTEDAMRPVRANDATVWVDGSRATGVPTHLPVVVQLVDAEGRVVRTDRLDPDSPLPTWLTPPASPQPTPDPTPEPQAQPALPTQPPTRPARRPFTGLAVGAGVLTAGLYGTAIATNLMTGPHEEAPVRRTLNQVGYWGSIGTGALTVGFAVGALSGKRSAR